MRRSKYLDAKLNRLDRKAGFGGCSQIPPNVQTVYFYDHVEGKSDQEINAEIEKQKAELVEKYGRRI